MESLCGFCRRRNLKGVTTRGVGLITLVLVLSLFLLGCVFRVNSLSLFLDDYNIVSTTVPKLHKKTYAVGRVTNALHGIDAIVRPTNSTVIAKPEAKQSTANIDKVLNSEELSATIDKVPKSEEVVATIDAQSQTKEAPAVIDAHPETKESPAIIAGEPRTKAASLADPTINATLLPNSTRSPLSALYDQAIKRRAINNTIILAFTDLGALDEAFNFYLTSFKPYNITNFLFVSTRSDVCTILEKETLPCFHLMNASDTDTASHYGTKVFVKKVNLRVFMLEEALLLGYNVIHSDVDIIFFEDPRPDIDSLCSKSCDLAILWDYLEYNSGFMYIRNTPLAVNTYQRAAQIVRKTGTDDQTALNKAIKSQNTTNLVVLTLPAKKYQNGKSYFKDVKRRFAGDRPCTTCIVVHNNWIVTIAAKIIRFREMHHWIFDEPDRYYTDPSRKFLTYSTFFWPENGTSNYEHEISALTNALAIGQILNRVVILPRFICPAGNRTNCMIIDHLYMESFDKVFKGLYRESTFLTHPMVPKEVKESTMTLPSTNDLNGASAKYIRSKLADIKESVIFFPSLYGNVSIFDTEEEGEAFRQKCSEGIRKSKYRQF